MIPLVMTQKDQDQLYFCLRYRFSLTQDRLNGSRQGADRRWRSPFRGVAAGLINCLGCHAVGRLGSASCRVVGLASMPAARPRDMLAAMEYRAARRRVRRKLRFSFIKKLMKHHGRAEIILTDGLRSFGAAIKEIGFADRQGGPLCRSKRHESVESNHKGAERLALLWHFRFGGFCVQLLTVSGTIN